MKWKILLIITLLLSSCKLQRNVEESEVTGTDQIRYKQCTEASVKGRCFWCESDRVNNLPPTFVPEAKWQDKLNEFRAQEKQGKTVCKSKTYIWRGELYLIGPKRSTLAPSFKEFFSRCMDDSFADRPCKRELIGDCKVTKVTVKGTHNFLGKEGWDYNLEGICKTKSSSELGPRKGDW